MRIGIITMVSDNYGNRLQNYALQNVLSELGNSVDTLNNPWNINYNVYLEWLKFNIKKFLFFITKRPERFKRRINFEKFNHDNISFSKYWMNKKKDRIAANQYYDMFICGSDQIWNLNCTNGVCGPYFLDFVSGKRKIAYAPSMGDYLLLDNDREKMRKALEEFYAISVREASMIQMLEQLNLPISIQTVVDPTLLLKKEDYIQGLKLEKMVSAGKYIFVYILGGTKAYGNIVNEAKKIAKQNGLQIKYVFDNNNAMIKNIGFDCSGCNPREFVSMIYNAEYVLTNSFHATVFSIIFKKNFTSYARGKSSGRITELLSSLGLEERFNLESNGCIIAINSYDKVYQLLANMKIESMIYLENALNVEGINSNE